MKGIMEKGCTYQPGLLQRTEAARLHPHRWDFISEHFSSICAVVSVHINKLSHTALLQKNQTGSEESTQREPLFTFTSLNADVSYSEQGWW